MQTLAKDKFSRQSNLLGGIEIKLLVQAAFEDINAAEGDVS